MSSGAPGFSRARPRADARGVEVLVLDVDGVLTDGSINLDDAGVETKRFNVRDGQGIACWIKLGLRVGIITRRGGSVTGKTGRGECIMHRARELGIPEKNVIRGAADKAAALDVLLGQLGLTDAQAAYIGDDLPDIRPMKRVACAIAPADAHPRVREVAAYVTALPGGHGAVREGIEMLVEAKGLTERMMSAYV